MIHSGGGGGRRPLFVTPQRPVANRQAFAAGPADANASHAPLHHRRRRPASGFVFRAEHNAAARHLVPVIGRFWLAKKSFFWRRKGALSAGQMRLVQINRVVTRIRCFLPTCNRFCKVKLGRIHRNSLL